MFRSIKYRFFATMTFFHAWFFFTCYGVYSSITHQPAPPVPQQYFLPFAGLFGLYFTLIGGIFATFAPLLPWARRARSFAHFKKWFLEELPTFIAVVTSLAALLPVLRAGWNELKKAHESGKLDVSHFSKVARKVADKAENVFQNGHGEPEEKPHGRRAA